MKPLIFILLVVFLYINCNGQEYPYRVNKVPWSSDKFDEFSPVYYRNGLVFASNRNSNPILNYSTEQNTGLFNINYVDTADQSGKSIRLLSNSLTSRLNDGPATFNREGDTIYFSRNLIVEGSQKELSGQRNRLGIFYAVLQGDKWTNITEMRFNSDSYNITTPYLSSDGKLLYFASDNPEGYGGSDIFVCSWSNGYWSNPENMGPVINTEGNEAYPFINDSGELFFSSDGHEGLGGKDIFFSKFVDSAWIDPVRLESPVNSKSDDFGYVSETGSEGYFTSGRDGSVDIFYFKTIGPLFLYCDQQKENSYCFSFPDDLSIDIDPLNLQFQWDFGDGKKEPGYVTQHCFPGKGIYTVRQNIIDKKTGKFIYNKLIVELHLNDIEQPFIQAVSQTPEGNSFSFDADKSNLPGKNILAYNWEFGDGEKASGKSVNHQFISGGKYNVKLGVKTADATSGKIHQECVSKIIFAGADSVNSDTAVLKKNFMNIAQYDKSLIDTLYSSSHEMAKNAIFQVVVRSSKSQIRLNDKSFAAILPKYPVREIYQQEVDLFTYVTDEGLDFMDVYPSYSDAVLSGLTNSSIRTYIPYDTAEINLWKVKKSYGTSTVNLFKSNDARLISGNIQVLDEVAQVLKNNNFRLQVAVHTDNTGNPSANLTLSLNRSKSIIEYLVQKGINRNRLSPAGYGGTRPIASNYSEAERKKNRRFDLVVISIK